MKNKPDINIGRRAAEEVLKAIGNCDTGAFCRSIGLSHKLLHPWQHGIAPSAVYLQRLALAGFDVNYILTGRTKRKGEDDVLE